MTKTFSGAGAGASGLSDIQKRGCRYTTREFLPSSAHWSRSEPQKLVKSRSVVDEHFNRTQELVEASRMRKFGRFHEKETNLKIQRTQSEQKYTPLSSSHHWYYNKRDNGPIHQPVPKRERTENFFCPPPASLVSGLRFTGKERVPVDLEALRERQLPARPWPDKNNRRLRPPLMFWEGDPAGYDVQKGNAGNGIGIFHPEAYNTG